MTKKWLMYTAFSTSTLLTLLLFLRLATHWPLLIKEWEKVEKTQIYYRKTNLKPHFRLYTGIVLLLALVEHVLANTRAIAKALHCTDNDFLGVMRAYFIYNFHFVFVLTGYSHWKGFLLAIMNIIKTFSWSYMDLFIILISVALADHFQALNQYLATVTNKMQTQTFWRQVREDYNTLAMLTRTVDRCLSKILLLSFGSNLYFVCFQLLNSMRPLRDFNEAVYFYWSIIYLVLKVCAVSLCAASVHDYSKEPKTVLYSVPTESYCTEVQRFLVQLTTDEVALTGLNFFSVTRTFIMSVAGTIVTYEVVLLQFNMASEMPPIPAPSSTNTTEECQWLNSVAY
ncbi:gustatory receptor for sugar taste 64f [Anabrus simplex]|uniref:gustatory receptor for sugar taste 64f n=1 Tax=Anabrus simplex TaxID=316456 RepID=UPI0035A39EDE